MRSATHEGVTSPPTYASHAVGDAYVRHTCLGWGAINVVAALACASIAWDYVPRLGIVMWLLVTCLNAALYCLIPQKFFHAFRLIDKSAAATHIAMASAFGAIWGASCILFGAALPIEGLLLLIGIGAFVTFAALPIFTFHRGAYPVFVVLFAPLAAVGFNRSSHLDHVEIYVGISLIIALLLGTTCARFVRSVTTALTKFARIGGADDPTLSDDLSLLLQRRIRTLKRVAREHKRATAILDAIAEAIITANEANLIDYMNPAAEALTGISFREAHGQKMENVVTINSLGGEDLLLGLIQQYLTGASVQSNGNRTVLKRQDGVEYEVEYQLSAIKNEQGNAAGTSCLIRDVTTKHNLIENVAWRSTHDPLTNLINRTEFEHRIKKLLSANLNAD